MSEKLHITMINSGIFTSVMLLFSRNIVIADTERMHGSNYAQLQKNGIPVLHDDIAADNPSYKLFLKNGFDIEYQNEEVVMVKRDL